MEEKDDKDWEWVLTEEELKDLEELKTLHLELKDRDDRFNYLVRFRSHYAPFRVPEIESIANIFHIPFEYDKVQARLVNTLREKYRVRFVSRFIWRYLTISSLLSCAFRFVTNQILKSWLQDLLLQSESNLLTPSSFNV